MAKSFFEKRRVKQALSQANEIEAKESRQLSFVAVQGRQKLAWNDTATVVVCTFVVFFVFALLMGYVIAPGGLLVYALFNSLKPQRTITMTPSEVIVWSHTFMRGKVKEVVESAPHALMELGEWTVVGSAQPIKLSDTELDELAAARHSFSESQQLVNHRP